VGERLLRTIAPRFEEIEAEIAALSDLRARPAGTPLISRRLPPLLIHYYP